MLLTDVAGVVLLVLLSLPPAGVDVTVRVVLLFLHERVRLVDGQEKGVEDERLSRRISEATSKQEASKQVAELLRVKPAGRGEMRESGRDKCFGLGCRGGEGPRLGEVRDGSF